MPPSRLSAALFALLLPSIAAAQDADGDGFNVLAGDCDDADPSVHPGGEVCSGIDDDCDGDIDEAGVSPFQCHIGLICIRDAVA